MAVAARLKGQSAREQVEISFGRAKGERLLNDNNSPIGHCSVGTP